MTLEQFKREVEKAVDSRTIPDEFDYKDNAADICGIIQEVASRCHCQKFIKDMPDGYNCPRAFWDWWWKWKA